MEIPSRREFLCISSFCVMQSICTVPSRRKPKISYRPGPSLYGLNTVPPSYESLYCPTQLGNYYAHCPSRSVQPTVFHYLAVSTRLVFLLFPAYQHVRAVAPRPVSTITNHDKPCLCTRLAGDRERRKLVLSQLLYSVRWLEIRVSGTVLLVRHTFEYIHGIPM